jgi:hypothetical protein
MSYSIASVNDGSDGSKKTAAGLRARLSNGENAAHVAGHHFSMKQGV